MPSESNGLNREPAREAILDAGSDPEHALDEALIQISLDGAREAALFHRTMEGQVDPGQVIDKGTRDFVSTVDVESAAIIVGHVRRRFPYHIIMAEDHPRDLNAGEWIGPDGPVLWIVDPLDGTTNWLHGYPSYGVSIATMDRRGLRTGVVVNSGNGEEFVARRGGGATLDGELIRVSTVEDPASALLGTGFPFKKLDLLPGYLAALGAMLRETTGVRRAGAAALDLCDLACGRMDGFWEHWLMSWDIAAGTLIVREAGGTFGPLPRTVDPSDAPAADDAAADPALAEAVRGGEAICRAFAGAGDLTRDMGGGFLAGNGRLEPVLRELWSEAVRTDDLARKASASRRV